MSSFAKPLQRVSSGSTLSSSLGSSPPTVEDLEHNPFDGKKNWDEFKKEYYHLEKKMKKALESLHVILIEYTKNISLPDSRSPSAPDNHSLWQNFQNISFTVKGDLDQMSDLFLCLKSKGDLEEPIKQNMLKRFKDIHQEHAKEYNRLNNSFELNKKKLELFNETLKLGELNVDKKIGSSTAIMMQQNQSLSEAVATSNRIVSQAKLVSESMKNQQLRMGNINLQMKNLIEEFAGVSHILKRIKYFKMKKTIAIFIIIVILAIFVIFRLFAHRV